MAARNRARLEAIVAGRNGRQERIERARATVWRWQEGAWPKGVDRLLRYKCASPGGGSPGVHATTQSTTDFHSDVLPGDRL